MKIQPFRSIRAKLVLSLGIPLLLSYAVLLSVDFVVNRRSAISEMQSAVLERADGAARVIDSRLTSVSQLSHALTTMAPAADASANGRVAAILREAINDRWVTSATIVLVGESGTPTAYVARRTDRRGGGGFGGGGRRFGLPAETTPVPTWFAGASTLTAGKWMLPDAASSDVGNRTSVYVEPLRSDGRVTGAIGLDVSLSAIRTLRAGPPGDFGRRPFGADTRPTTEPTTRGAFDGRERFGGFNDGPPPNGDAGERREPRGDRPDDARGPPLGGIGDEVADALSPSTSLMSAAIDPLADFAIFDGEGRLLVAPASDAVRPPPHTIFETATAIGSPAMASTARQAIAGQAGLVSVSGLKRVIPGVPDDTDHWVAMSPISATGWFLVSAVGQSSHVQPVIERLIERAIFLTCGLFVMLAVVLWISMRMSSRLERLDAAVARLATGDLDVAVPETGPPDEIGRLTRGFATMTRDLREHVAALTKQSAAREKVEGELRIARQIQVDLLPKTFPPFPDRTEFELHAINEPALQVGGDFYDFFFTPDGWLTVVVADVSGKGVPAALLMAVTRTLVRSLAGADKEPLGIVQGVNAALAHDSPSHMFVTMFLFQYEPVSGRIRYVNAGHPPPIRLRAGQPPTPFCNHGSPIVGLDESGLLGDFEQREETLLPGETMLVYTDGVTDAPGATAHDYMELPGLIDALQGQGGAAPRVVCDHLMESIVRKKVAGLRDDTTILALRRTLL